MFWVQICKMILLSMITYSSTKNRQFFAMNMSPSESNSDHFSCSQPHGQNWPISIPWVPGNSWVALTRQQNTVDILILSSKPGYPRNSQRYPFKTTIGVPHTSFLASLFFRRANMGIWGVQWPTQLYMGVSINGTPKWLYLYWKTLSKRFSSRIFGNPNIIWLIPILLLYNVIYGLHGLYLHKMDSLVYIKICFLSMNF